MSTSFDDNKVKNYILSSSLSIFSLSRVDSFLKTTSAKGNIFLYSALPEEATRDVL